MPNPQRAPQRIVPYLCYRDAPAAIEFLCKSFGFEEQFRLELDDDRIGHAEIALDGNVVMLASAHPEMGLASPAELGAVHTQVHVDVEDVDAHFARASQAGATIAAEPEDQPYGDRMYRVVDPEGHRWSFSTHVRDVSPEEIRTAYAGK